MKCLPFQKGLTAETEQNTKLPRAFTTADFSERLLQTKRKFPPAFLLMSARN